MTRNFSFSRTRDVEPELWKELSALHALDQDCAVTQRVLDLGDGHASRQLVENLLRLVLRQNRQAIMQRVPLRWGQALDSKDHHHHIVEIATAFDVATVVVVVVMVQLMVQWWFVGQAFPGPPDTGDHPPLPRVSRSTRTICPGGCRPPTDSGCWSAIRSLEPRLDDDQLVRLQQDQDSTNGAICERTLGREGRVAGPANTAVIGDIGERHQHQLGRRR